MCLPGPAKAVERTQTGPHGLAGVWGPPATTTRYSRQILVCGRSYVGSQGGRAGVRRDGELAGQTNGGRYRVLSLGDTAALKVTQRAALEEQRN